MIQGVVNARHEAVVRLHMRGPSGQESDIEVIIDSGFSSSLTLPMVTVTALGLARRSGGGANLADGSVRHFDIFDAELSWDSAWRPVLAYGVGNEPLMGMGLLSGHKLTVEVVPGGSVEILRLP